MFKQTEKNKNAPKRTLWKALKETPLCEKIMRSGLGLTVVGVPIAITSGVVKDPATMQVLEKLAEIAFFVGPVTFFGGFGLSLFNYFRPTNH